MCIAYIGLFWLIDGDTLEYKRLSLSEEIAKQGRLNYIKPSVTREHIWNSEVKTKCKSDKEYDYYPSGQVNYNRKKGIFEIKADSCLCDDSLSIFCVRHAFKLLDKPMVVIPKKSFV